MTKKKKKEVRQGESEAAALAEPYVKPAPIPYAKRHRVTLICKEPSEARGSFKDECDINQIVSKFVDTGMLSHQQRGTPQYGDAPDQTLYEAAVTQAELRSHAEEGTFEEYEKSQEAASEPPEAPKEPETGSDPDNGENALHAETQTAEVASSG